MGICTSKTSSSSTSRGYTDPKSKPKAADKARGRRAGIRKDMHINIWYDESDSVKNIQNLEKKGIQVTPFDVAYNARTFANTKFMQGMKSIIITPTEYVETIVDNIQPKSSEAIIDVLIFGDVHPMYRDYQAFDSIDKLEARIK